MGHLQVRVPCLYVCVYAVLFQYVCFCIPYLIQPCLGFVVDDTRAKFDGEPECMCVLCVCVFVCVYMFFWCLFVYYIFIDIRLGSVFEDRVQQLNETSAGRCAMYVCICCFIFKNACVLCYFRYTCVWAL